MGIKWTEIQDVPTTRCPKCDVAKRIYSTEVRCDTCYLKGALEINPAVGASLYAVAWVIEEDEE